VYDGTVEIKSISREAGVRSKVGRRLARRERRRSRRVHRPEGRARHTIVDELAARKSTSSSIPTTRGFRGGGAFARYGASVKLTPRCRAPAA
jgi:hypothetical protein